MTIQDHILPLLETKFVEEGFEDCFLVELVFHDKQKKLEVFLDADKGLAFDRCQKISRFLEATIDEQNWLGEKYILEVSSPGISRPLLFLRQYVKNLGRKVDITMNDGRQIEALLEKAGPEDMISVKYQTKRKEGKKNIKEEITEELKLEDIKKTIVKISFS
jgi:ribosome maturation factor RimP